MGRQGYWALSKMFLEILHHLKTSKYLTVNDDRIAYRAIIGDQNGRAKHNPVDYDVKAGFILILLFLKEQNSK